jgi:hypothetical protein
MGEALTTTDTDARLTAVYYPFSRCLDLETLKRAVLVYDRVLFIDPKSPQVRAGLYSVENHQQFLPNDAAQRLAADWQAIETEYRELERAGVVEFVDPLQVSPGQAIDALITGNMQADMNDKQISQLFADCPSLWSMLRSSIPMSAWPFLHHQYTPRVLYEENTRGAFVKHGEFSHALIADGRPDQEFSMPETSPSAATAITGQRRFRSAAMNPEYAVVLPYYLGSSLATSMAMAICLDREAVPLTDSTPHFKLLSTRFARASQTYSPERFPGLQPQFSLARAHTQALVERRLIDKTLGPGDLQRLSMEDVLEYRSVTAEQRMEFRNYMQRLVASVTSEPWSPDLDREMTLLIQQAQAELDSHTATMREAYRRIFRNAAVGLGMAVAPQLLNVIFPGIPLIVAFVFGAGSFTGVLADPIKDLLNTLTTRRATNGLSYLVKLRGENALE